MDFLVDISPNMELPKYEMILCKMNEEPIMTLKNIVDFQYQANFANIDELSFKIPFYRTSEDGQAIENERFEAVEGDMLIKLNKTKFFYIHYAKEITSEDGSIVKEVQAYSREYELAQKKLVGYSGVSRKIFVDVLPGEASPVDENGLDIGFMNYVHKQCSWRVVYVAYDIAQKQRALDFSNSNLLQAFQEVQKTFGCLFVYDTINKTIRIEKIDDLGIDRGLKISNKNFLKTLEKSIKSDEIKTRLYLYGRDNISVQRLGVLGKPYIENYEFYRSRKYMSQELMNRFNAYDAFIATKQTQFKGLLTQVDNQNPILRTKMVEMTTLLTELKVIQQDLDVAISNSLPIGNIRTLESAKMSEILVKQGEIESVELIIDGIYENINTLSRDTEISNFLEPQYIRELDSFIREETFSDSNYTEDNLEELLAEGKKILSRISQPAIQFDMNVIDFLSIVEAQHTWKRFVLGDKVRLYHKELNFNFLVRLVSYTHSPDGNQLNLKFSTTNSIDDSSLYLRDILNDLKTTSSSVDFNKYKWDKGQEAQLEIANYVDHNLNLAKQALLKADNQKPMIDERGYWGYKIDPDTGLEDPEQIRITNNVLAMTKDNWNSIDVAISAEKGINATLLNGKIGNLATLNTNQIRIGAPGEKIPKDMLEGFDDINNFIDTVYPSEIQGIRDQIDGKVNTWFYAHEPKMNNLPAIDWTTTGDKDNHLGDTFYDTETGYSYRFAKLDNIYQWLRITDSDITRALELASKAQDTADSKRRVFLITPFTPYDAGDLWRDEAKTDLQICINSRLTGAYSASDWDDATNIQDYLNQQFSQLSMSISGLETSINNSMSDGKITSIEANNLKLALAQANKESTDVIGVALSLGITAERTVYSNKLSELTLELNKWIDKTNYPLDITPAQRALIINLFGEVENLKSKLVNAIMLKRENNTKSYIDGEVDQLELAMTAFDTALDKFSSDLSLTLAEANSLKILLESVKSESTDIINIGSSLGISTVPYSTAISSLNTFLNNNWFDKTYPLTITAAQRQLVTNSFKDVESKKSLLVNAIMVQREINTKAYADSKIVDFNLNVLAPAVSGLTVQIDGKIETWNQTADPSLTWTDKETKDKHIGDMWYHTGNKELTRYNGTAWVLIEDKKAYEALNLADKKRIIFINTPTTPYTIGDLWKVSGIEGVDFKVCSITRNTGAYNAADWTVVNNSKTYIDTQKTELNNAITALGTKINNTFSDGVITNIEAQGLKLARNSVVKEASDVLAIAGGLGLSIGTLQTAINTLNTEAGKYIDQLEYPILVDLPKRNLLNSAFTSLESAIVTMYDNIESKKVANLGVSFNTLIGGVQDQIDGKIDNWFFSIDPTLSNAPANLWTTNAIKDKHLDDLYYNTVKGTSYRFVKEGTVYKWARIVDADIDKALAAANAAQTTANQKMTVFLTQPTVPYHVGDLWRVSANDTDLKICITSQTSGAFNNAHWVNATNVGSTINALGNKINDFSTDLNLTLAEANALKQALENAKSESTELINTATSLAITTEKTTYQTALNVLTNFLNANWFGKVYPLILQAGHRDTVLANFKTVEETKTLLINRITKARADKALADSKDYTDNNAVMTGQNYNGVVIDSANGFVATRGDGKARTTVNATEGIKIEGNINGVWQNNFYVDTNGMLRAKNMIIDGLDADASKVFSTQPTPPYKVNDLWKVAGIPGVEFKICVTARATGSYVASDWSNVTNNKDYADTIKNLTPGVSISGNRTTIDRDKVKVTHSDGYYSEMNATGFIRQYQYGAAMYASNVYSLTVETGTPGHITYYKPAIVRKLLPTSYRGQSPIIVPTMQGFVSYISSGDSRSALNNVSTDVFIDIVPNWYAATPYLDIEAYVVNGYGVVPSNIREVMYSPLKLVIFLIMQ